MKAIITLLLLFLCAELTFSQNDFINAEHPVYTFLKSMSVRGLLKNYSDAVLPLPRKSITDYLLLLESNQNGLTHTEKELIQKYKARFGNSDFDIVITYPGSLLNNKEKKFYFYRDSLVSFSASPFFGFSHIYSDQTKRYAALASLGGFAYGSYSNWFGFSVSAANGKVIGNRKTAAEDIDVNRSFTFNKTGIDYFDETEGHFALHSGLLSVQVGRERILWGRGYKNRLLLSDNPPLFDFIRFKLAYKALSYDFLHGWLVQKPEIRFIDSLGFDVKTKSPKYIASNRLGADFGESFSAGISQVIIYSNRPMEGAYLNPFLLWESAQRSLNDLDNSFLQLDAEINPLDGLSFSGTYIFDDINFDIFNDWNNISNRSGWQISSFITYPLMLRNMVLKAEYIQIRPYTFSHYGAGESLSYTNNGHMLGYEYNPNSALLSLLVEYNVTADLELKAGYDFLRHGRNQTDADGNLIKNYGGSVFEFPRLTDSGKTSLFEGILSEIHIINFTVSYELLRNYLLSFKNSLQLSSTGGSKENRYSQFINLNLFFL